MRVRRGVRVCDREGKRENGHGVVGGRRSIPSAVRWEHGVVLLACLLSSKDILFS